MDQIIKTKNTKTHVHLYIYILFPLLISPVEYVQYLNLELFIDYLL